MTDPVSVATMVAAAVAFLAMEAVSYSAHRWLMHGPGMSWHRSHHAPPDGRFERNDLFPLCFSVVGAALFAGGAIGPALGVTAYGAAYLAVHEIVIHRRLPVAVPSTRYLRWLRDAHAVHHRTGGEPYGMLLPLRVSAPVEVRTDRLDRRSRMR
jgi:beta-carotene 3-hydroxylase